MTDQKSLARNRTARLESGEAWAAFLVVRVVSPICGMVILVAQAFHVADPRLAITVAGVGLCGPTVAASAAAFMNTFRGTR